VELVILGVVVAPIVLIVMVATIGFKEISRIAKIPISGPPQTPDEFIAMQYRAGTDRLRRYWPYLVIAIFSTCVAPWLLCIAGMLLSD